MTRWRGSRRQRTRGGAGAGAGGDVRGGEEMVIDDGGEAVVETGERMRVMSAAAAVFLEVARESNM